MIHILDPEITYMDEHNLYSRYLVYHKVCGGLLLVLPGAVPDGDMRILIDSAKMCHCYDHHYDRKVPALDTDQIVTRLLNDLSNAIGNCETVTQAQQMVWKLASAQEMRERGSDATDRAR